MDASSSPHPRGLSVEGNEEAVNGEVEVNSMHKESRRSAADRDFRRRLGSAVERVEARTDESGGVQHRGSGQDDTSGNSGGSRFVTRRATAMPTFVNSSESDDGLDFPLDSWEGRILGADVPSATSQYQTTAVVITLRPDLSNPTLPISAATITSIYTVATVVPVAATGTGTVNLNAIMGGGFAGVGVLFALIIGLLWRKRRRYREAQNKPLSVTHMQTENVKRNVNRAVSFAPSSIHFNPAQMVARGSPPGVHTMPGPSMLTSGSDSPRRPSDADGGLISPRRARPSQHGFTKNEEDRIPNPFADP
ncbi:hypothetical protein AAF712_004518 [Marasmius tenuissimus]|uniref:Transmembrane protein n=1 Tax=Marasmius tenuissimus TaxID=585030 RepID=A0ABR3A4G5_9AGAR